MILTGLALCDIVLDEYALTRITGRTRNRRQTQPLLFDACELQLDNWDKYGMYLPPGMELADFLSDEVLGKTDTLIARTLQELKSKRFKSFHCPTNSGNISSPDDRVRRHAVEVTMKSMDAAQAFGADVFVLHPCKHDWGYWEGFKDKVGNYMEMRGITSDIFTDTFRELAEYYTRKGFTFKIGIENLEFNQYPSTVPEIMQILQRCRGVWSSVNDDPSKVGIVMDLQHLKHSKAILKENLPQPLEFFLQKHHLEEYKQYAHRPICREHNYHPPEGEDHPVINQLFREHRDDIILVHLGGNDHRHATHDPILYDLRKFHFGKHQYDQGMLNIRQVLDIMHHSGYQGAVILEVSSKKELVDDRFEDQATSMQNVRNYLEHLRR